MADRRSRRFSRSGGRLGGVFHRGFPFVHLLAVYPSNQNHLISAAHSRPACRHGFLIHEYRPLCSPHGRGEIIYQNTCAHYPHTPGAHPPHRGSQAQRQFLEFLHHFYDVFPEYKRMDVSQQVTQTATLHLVLIRFLCA